MARVNPAELPGSMAVLGLVIEQPNDTVSHIGQCLGRRFHRARFARSTAHSALPRLAHLGRVRRTHLEQGNDRSLDRYEATAEGVAAFQAWMFEAPGARPALREAMYGRIELCRPEDLPRLIKMARREEAVSDDMYREAAWRLRQQRLKTTNPANSASQASRASAAHYTRKIREVLLYADPMHWSARSERYAVIAERLEEIAEEIALPAGENAQEMAGSADKIARSPTEGGDG